MPTTTNVEQVKLNVMTKTQYASATKNPNELYAVTDADGTTTEQSIDADIVGTLTVASNGDVSGLDYSNYLVYPGTLDMSSASSFEMVFAFTTANAVSTAYILNGAGMGYGSEHDIAITINSSEKLYFYVNASSDTITGTTTIQPNTKYYVKVVYDGTDYILSLSEDGNNWNIEGSVLATEKPGPLRERKYAIGRSVASVFSVMHMKECYIKENSILVWQGMDAPGLHQRVVKGHEVIAFQAPTAGNNYKWYRKYADGWVEQGGITTSGSIVQSVALPVTMADTNYTISLVAGSNNSGGLNNVGIVGYENVSTTGFDTRGNTVNGQSQSSTSTSARRWYVAGMYAQ